MRIETALTDDDSEAVQKLADERGLQKDRAYTDISRTGVNVEQRREAIKDRIIQFFEDQHPSHKKRNEALREQYAIDQIERRDEGRFEVVHNGNTYGFGAPHELQFVNGESVFGSICPDCASDEIDLDTDEPNYTCEECGHTFDKADRKGVPDEDEAEHVQEFARRRQALFDYVVGELTNLLDGLMGTYDGCSHHDWMHPGMYQYRNGFQEVTVPFWTTDKSQITFTVDRYIGSYESVTNPLYRAAQERLVDDYRKLVQEIQAVNTDADRVEPIFIDRRGRKPEIIEIRGLNYEETHLPLYTVGYEVEKVEPSADDLEPEHDADATVTWIRVTGDKPIEQDDEDSGE